MRRAALALAVALMTAGAWGATTTVTPFPDSDAVLIVAGNTAYIVAGNPPVPVATWVIGVQPDPRPDPMPTPSKVSGILILEEQADRTVKQAKVLDDPVWQSLCLLQGISYRIEDDDLPSVAKYLAAAGTERPMVCYIDSDGKVIGSEPLPETVEEMRKLIGGVK